MSNVSEQNVKWFVRYRPGLTRRPDSTIPPNKNNLWGKTGGDTILLVTVRLPEDHHKMSSLQRISIVCVI